jgi:hypothetical protein
VFKKLVEQKTRLPSTGGGGARRPPHSFLSPTRARKTIFFNFFLDDVKKKFEKKISF